MLIVVPSEHSVDHRHVERLLIKERINLTTVCTYSTSRPIFALPELYLKVFECVLVVISLKLVVCRVKAVKGIDPKDSNNCFVNHLEGFWFLATRNEWNINRIVENSLSIFINY